MPGPVLSILGVAALLLPACPVAPPVRVEPATRHNRATDEPTAAAVTPTPPPPDPRVIVSLNHGIWPEVWSHSAPGIASYEFKVNCPDSGGVDEPCFLSDLDAVTVEGPDGRVFALERDFNMNAYSGEVTRRWVLYGPDDGGLPAGGEYLFRYFRGGATVLEHPVRYTPGIIDHPTDVRWERAGDDLSVTWTPPPDVAPGMFYKVILWSESGTPDAFVSLEFPWNARTGTLPDVPLVDGGRYSMNVAVFFDDGYAHSDYVRLMW